MKYNITELDKSTLLQTELNYRYKLYVIDKSGNTVDMIDGINSIGNYNINSEADIRRTASFVLQLDSRYSSKHIESKIDLWIGYDFQLKIGIYNIRKNDYLWYDCGYYSITSTNTSYDAVTNTLATELSDWFVKLNGTRNGQIGGAPTIVIPNVDSDGNKVTIRKATILVLNNNNIHKYIIQDIGEFYGMKENNKNYLEYQEKNPDWNKLPHDLKYNCGCYVSNILTDIRDLYPNCEMFYDIYNNFCFNMIPSCKNDPIVLDNNYLQKIIISENSESVAYDITSIKNVTEVFGKTYDIDRFCETAGITSNVYNLTLDKYETYDAGEIISFTAPMDNVESMKLNINSLNSIPIFKEYTTTYIEPGSMKKDNVYSVRIAYTDGEYAAYFLGQYQPHALCVLTDTIPEESETDIKKHFEENYNCKNIAFQHEPDNPFTIQKIGIVLDTKSGDEFDNIISDSVALSNAIYHNTKSSSNNDTVTLTTKMIPFIDVNEKVSYKKQQEEEAHEYIIKSISHDLSAMTTSMTLKRFHQLNID